MPTGKKAIVSILAVWLCANFIPHLIVFLATGKVYYQLAPLWQSVAESSIMLLNLVLPLIALRYSSPQEAHILQSQGLFSYMEGNTEEAKIHLENSLEILRRWRMK